MTVPRDRYWRLRPVPDAGRYRRWLTARGSLTSRIEARCSAFSLKLLFQGPRRATPDERFLGAGAGTRRTLVREVCLYCGSAPVVFAHSALKRRDLRGPWRSLARLGTRPLAAALFANPQVRRYPPQFRRLNRRDELHARACAALGVRLPPLWARRSLFTLHKSPILVTEVFLPEILRL